MLKININNVVCNLLSECKENSQVLCLLSFRGVQVHGTWLYETKLSDAVTPDVLLTKYKLLTLVVAEENLLFLCFLYGIAEWVEHLSPVLGDGRDLDIAG